MAEFFEVQVLAGPGKRLAFGLAMIEEIPLVAFEDSPRDEAWSEDVAVEAPECEGSYANGSLAEGGEGEVVGGASGEALPSGLQPQASRLLAALHRACLGGSLTNRLARSRAARAVERLMQAKE